MQLTHTPEKDGQYGAELAEGEFCFQGQDEHGQPKWFRMRRPGAAHECHLAIRPQKNALGASWQWNGDRSRPSFEPSINCHVCRWHGWLRDGVLNDA